MKTNGFEFCKNCFLRAENNDLSAYTRAELSTCRSGRSYSAGSCLLSQDSLPTQFYCLRAGRVGALNQDTSGHQVLITSFEPGQLFPLSHLFSNLPDAQELIAVAGGTLCQFPIKRFKELLAEDAGLVTFVASLYHQERARQNERIMVLLEKSAESKVLRSLRYFSNEDGLCMASRKEISLWTHLTIETVIRTLSDLQNRGIIKKSRSTLQICKSQKSKFEGTI